MSFGDDKQMKLQRGRLVFREGAILLVVFLKH